MKITEVKKLTRESWKADDKFKKISYEQFERLGDSSSDYDETEIDGYYIIVARSSADNVIGLWYQKAKVGSMNMDSLTKDEMGYSEIDPFWPYEN